MDEPMDVPTDDESMDAPMDELAPMIIPPAQPEAAGEPGDVELLFVNPVALRQRRNSIELQGTFNSNTQTSNVMSFEKYVSIKTTLLIHHFIYRRRRKQALSSCFKA